ncbi:MAG: iron-sulfur cluster insertion protein ErpA [Anaerolineales bacterium]|nr:iron-sulfur cluster insertion protein ErpA [Anaerolineales bacterium]MCB9126636.1 iron-sulfur cluster insertion protein ErpA [Ardenticatenales bacterium]MCB9172738.1 iron-sulfur cluster insertion protein ErpA [Ardenticatenales bacterium]
MDIPVLDRETTTIDAPVAMTETAARVVRNLLEEKNIPDYHLRVFVQGGGCSGMQYGMAFEAAPRVGDTVLEVEGVKLLVDPQSMSYIRGAQIDYVESLMGGGFRVDNPNAVTSCGCGHSFRTAGASSAASSGGGCGSGGCGC